MGLALPILSLATTALGAVSQAAGQRQAGEAAAQQAAYQASVARNNQILAERAAEDALARGRVEENRQRMATAQLRGRQRAVLAASGVQVDTGSALDITTDTARLGELDALTIRSNAEREAANLRAQGTNFGAEAQLLNLQGQNAQAAGRSGAFGTLLGGVGSVASKWYGFKKEGVF